MTQVRAQTSVFAVPEPALTGHRKAISQAYLTDETAHVESLLESMAITGGANKRIQRLAASMVAQVRTEQADQGALDAFMQQYDLSSEEGVLLMCLAEALLRIPDVDTAEKLIRDKLGDADWEEHLGQSKSVFVNASTWGLMLTGRLVRLGSGEVNSPATAINRLVAKSGEPVIRLAVRQAMRIMGRQYVMGRTIEEALDRSVKKGNRSYRYSFDMLGEAAFTMPDADKYFAAYVRGIKAIGQKGPFSDIFAAPSISVKLSALHPRYEYGQRARARTELTPRLLELVQLAAEQGIALTVDAEEADRLRLSLDIFAAVFADPSLREYNGLGLAVQAYQKRAPAVLSWLTELAREHKKRIPIRLVKGAYWDTEIKRAQEQGLKGYPVFTRKGSTDVSYLACAKMMLEARDALYCQFATHNAHTIAAIHEFAGDNPEFEYQRLHGMGEELYRQVIGPDKLDAACRVYAPVGSHEDLLPYLVRRLLENGANTSFVNRVVDEELPIEEVVADPVAAVQGYDSKPHPQIPLPVDLYGSTRRNSQGVNLASQREMEALAESIQAGAAQSWSAGPLIAGGNPESTTPIKTLSPYARSQQVGEWQPCSPATLERALEASVGAYRRWDDTPVDQRAACLDRAADAMEASLGEFVAYCVHEAGKTLDDAVAEVREAVDFCRYYAHRARLEFNQPTALPGPTGEANSLGLAGRGVFACISPWNFPMAIFTGQIVAALAAGNSVLAKPAEQTTLIGHRVARLLHEAGVPEDVLQLVPGDGLSVGAPLCADRRIAGVAFTGSTQTAQAINRGLAARDGAIGTLIAETGGQNAMLADSSALPEQLVGDVILSAFGSAGQRCSALRVLFIQTDVADRVIEMLAGAMDELVVGNPGLLRTDVGPVIDEAALAMLTGHAERMDKEARLIHTAPLQPETESGLFFAPRAYEIDDIGVLEKEVFGPVLHVVRYRSQDLDAVIDAVNNTGYGLTLGVHSRIEDTVEHVTSRVRVGNCYINRNITGAVVGVQPFGGEGLSGTGPKAGGPHYLHRFATERTLTINTAAVGGNAGLLAMDD